jgi:Protein O-mannosyl-transferase TMEM260-like
MLKSSGGLEKFGLHSFHANASPLRALRRRGVLSALVTLIAFLVYLRTLAPGVLDGDSGEFQFAAWGWTLAHPTGYPLYLLLGGLWQHLLPFGNPAYRLNLLSAIFAALTVGVSYCAFVHVARHRGAAFVAALTLAVAPTFWSQATESEVYALNSLFVALLTYLALKWEERRAYKYSAAWALTFGLALTHHRSIILLLPAFAAFFAPTIYQRWKALPAMPRAAYGWRRDVSYALLVALPLLLYLYVPLRGAATPYAQLHVSSAQTIVTFDNTPGGWLMYSLGRTFESELTFNVGSWQSLLALPTRLSAQFNPIGLSLGVFGLAVLFYRRRWPLAALTLFSFMGVVLFDVAYHIGDIADFYTPAYFFFALWIAAGLGALLEFLSAHASLHGSLLPVTALLLAAAALPIQNFSNAFNQEDRSLQTQWGERWRATLESNLPPGAILISNDRDEMTPMWYLQIVEGLRPDALGLFPLISPDPAYANTMRLIESVIDSGRPVFLVKNLPGLALRFRLDPTPPDLYRVASEPLPAPQFSSDAVVGGKLRVRGFSIVSGVARPGSTLGIAVYWQPLAPLDRDYTTSLQVFDGAGSKIAQGDDHKPGGDTYPTSLWQSGETLQDRFTLALPPDMDAGAYHLAVQVYDADEALGDLTEIGTLQVGN